MSVDLFTVGLLGACERRFFFLSFQNSRYFSTVVWKLKTEKINKNKSERYTNFKALFYCNSLVKMWPNFTKKVKKNRQIPEIVYFFFIQTFWVKTTKMNFLIWTQVKIEIFRSVILLSQEFCPKPENSFSPSGFPLLFCGGLAWKSSHTFFWLLDGKRETRRQS